MRFVSKVAVVLPLLLVAGTSLRAQDSVLSSSDGLKSLELSTDGTIGYSSGDGTLSMWVDDQGIHAGGFSLLISQGPSPNTYDLTVTIGDRQVSGVVEVTAEGAVPSSELTGLSDALSAFRLSTDGQLLMEAGSGFDPRGIGVELIGSDPGPTMNEGIRNCLANLLNATAAGAAMVLGCGTTAVAGPAAFRLACGGGVAWYLSSLSFTWDACRVATW